MVVADFYNILRGNIMITTDNSDGNLKIAKIIPDNFGSSFKFALAVTKDMLQRCASNHCSALLGSMTPRYGWLNTTFLASRDPALRFRLSNTVGALREVSHCRVATRTATAYKTLAHYSAKYGSLIAM